MRRLLAAALLAALGLLALAGTAAAASWRDAADVRGGLANAELELVLHGNAQAAQEARAAQASAGPLLAAVRPVAPAAALRVERGLAVAVDAAERGDAPALAAARAEVWTAILAGSYRATLAAVEAGRVNEARGWLLVREFRAPTRFSRPGAEGTRALRALAGGRLKPAQALAAVRADLLDTYQGRLREALETLDGAAAAGVHVPRCRRGRAGARLLRRARALVSARAASAGRRVRPARCCCTSGDRGALSDAAKSSAAALAGFRAAPLSPAEEERRAAQFQRFLGLVPVEYGRGVADGRVTRAFEIQEAITFRDGAAQAFGDLEAALSARDPGRTARMEAVIAKLGRSLDEAARGARVAAPDAIKADTQTALGLADATFPERWKGSGSSADFDVIRASLLRLRGALAAGEYGAAEQARLEAYAIFELGPEQRLRGLAPELFTRIEGLFWYGDGGESGLAQLVRQKASPAELTATSLALDRSLKDAEDAVGAGPKSTTAIVTNTAIIVFREGLEAVLILAALLAGMVGERRRFRRPLLLGAAVAFVASAATWVVAQTVLGSLGRYGEKLEAIVSLVAIGMLLLVLNWFYHRVYWTDHLAGLQGRKKKLLRGATIAGVPVLGLTALGFSSVYREGFETTLFLQALVLEAGPASVLLGVAIGLTATIAVGLLTMALERKLPYKRMLMATGLLITWVLVVMAGTTIQTLQVVGWVPVHPIEGLRLPYWAGLWLGVFPTWEGVAAQAGAAVFVLGSYFAAEQIRQRRRRAMFAPEQLPGARRSDARDRARGRPGLRARRVRTLSQATSRRRRSR